MHTTDCTFHPGDVVVFEPNNFNQEYWNGLTEEEKIKYYGALGYGEEKMKLFVFLCEVFQAPDQHGVQYGSGHCILATLGHNADRRIEMMRHTSDFRLATEEEV